LIIVDREFLGLLEGYNPKVKLVVDEDTDATTGELSGAFDSIIQEGLEYDTSHGSGWDGLQVEPENEEDVIALAYTSGTTARPKVSRSDPLFICNKEMQKLLS
jgi:long-subunit acyl-CoA synthetase (AMP-forming)